MKNKPKNKPKNKTLPSPSAQPDGKAARRSSSRVIKLGFTLLVFLATFLFCQLCIPYTLIQQESHALFLNTPDYLRDTFSAPWPLVHLAVNFVVQFFHFPYVGPLLMALLVTVLFLLLRLLFRRKPFGFSIVFISLLAASCLLLSLNDELRENERFCRVEYAASRHDWARVLQTATPQLCRHERQLLPYALLALTETGQLPERLFVYPIRSVDDFCPEQWSDRRGLSFKACLYECMGIPNEALHNTFQAATALPHGCSFGTLRALVRLNRALGNDVLAQKYATILSHSTLHRGWGKREVPPQQQAESADEDAEAGNTSASAPLLTPTYFYNVTSLIAHGAYSPTLADRSLCGLLVQRDLARFVQIYNLLPHAEGDAVPAHYREAFLLADPNHALEAQGPYASYYHQEAVPGL